MPGPFARVRGLRPDLRNPLPPHPLNRGRVAWWLAVPGRTSGGGIWYDIAGPNHATLNSVSIPASGTSGWQGSSRPGTLGAHLLTDGSAAYASAPMPAGIGGATAATIAAWVYRSATGTKQAFGFGSVSGSNRFNLIWFTDNNIYVQVGSGFVSAASTATGWHRLAHVYDSGASPTQALYLDGVPLTLTTAGGGAFGTGALPSAANLGGCWAGREITNGYCAGSYDDLTAASRAWSAAEARADYDLSRRGYPGVLPRTWTAAAALWSAGAAATPTGWLLDSPPPARMPIKTVPY